jgi:hypothetical protein
MTEDSFPNPLDLDALREHAKEIAKNEGFAENTPQADAFRHIYTNAMIAWKYGVVGGGLYTEVIGNTFEGLELGKFIAVDMVQSAAALLGFEESKDRISLGEYALDSIMDITNNQIGLMIGSTATSKEDLIAKVSKAIRSGEVILNPDQIPNMLKQNQSNLDNDSSLIATGKTGPLSEFNPRLFESVARTRSKNSSLRQIAIASSTSIAQALLKSRQKSIEDAIFNVFTGNRGSASSLSEGFSISSLLPGAGGSQISIPGILGGFIEQAVGAAFGRSRTRTSVAESDRSREAGSNWNLSQGQQQAMLAQWMQRGMRNL